MGRQPIGMMGQPQVMRGQAGFDEGDESVAQSEMGRRRE